LFPPQHVKAYVRGNKNDYNDARAIAEATRVPDMRFVEVKTVEQQDEVVKRKRTPHWPVGHSSQTGGYSEPNRPPIPT